MIRVQRQRIKGWRMPENTVYVGRPTLWGNPWAPCDAAVWSIPPAARAAWAVGMYSDELTHWGLLSDWYYFTSEATFARVDREIAASGARNMAEYAAIALRGRNLACWCPIGAPCHADLLLELAR